MDVDTGIRRKAGFTLIELIVVMAILGILAVLAIPRVGAYTARAERITCEVNRKQLEKHYGALVEMDGIEAGPSSFTAFVLDFFAGQAVCPKDGVISWNVGEVNCSVHDEDDSSGGHEDEEGGGEEVPFL